MTSNFYTTFNELHKQQACQERYKYLEKKLGGISKYGRNMPIRYSRILEINGLDDTLWALQKKGSDVSERVLQLFIVGVAYNVLHFFENEYPNDDRVRNCIKIRHLHAHGEATKKELDAARAACTTCSSRVAMTSRAAVVAKASRAIMVAKASGAAKVAKASRAAVVAKGAWAARAAKATWAVRTAKAAWAARTAWATCSSKAAWAARTAWATRDTAGSTENKFQTALLMEILKGAEGEQ